MINPAVKASKIYLLIHRLDWNMCCVSVNYFMYLYTSEITVSINSRLNKKIKKKIVLQSFHFKKQAFAGYISLLPNGKHISPTFVFFSSNKKLSQKEPYKGNPKRI